MAEVTCRSSPRLRRRHWSVRVLPTRLCRASGAVRLRPRGAGTAHWSRVFPVPLRARATHSGPMVRATNSTEYPLRKLSSKVGQIQEMLFEVRKEKEKLLLETRETMGHKCAFPPGKCIPKSKRRSSFLSMSSFLFSFS